MNENNGKKDLNEKDIRAKQYEERKRRQNEISNQAFDLMGKATELAKAKEFDQALELYTKSKELLKEINWINQIEPIQKAIDQIQIEKIHYLKSLEKQKFQEEKQHRIEAEQTALLEEQARKHKELEEKKKREFQEKKAHQSELSEQAYKLMGDASNLIKTHDYDNALELYNKALELFEEINWTHEIQALQKIIYNVNNDKAIYFRGLEERRIREEKEKKLKAEQETRLEEEARTYREEKECEKARKMEEIENEKEFKQKIDNLISEVDKKVREYEIEIKKNNYELEPPYLDAIETYKMILSMLNERSWVDQLRIAENQIQYFEKKMEQDKRLREIEAQKLKKQKEYEEFMRYKKD